MILGRNLCAALLTGLALVAAAASAEPLRIGVAQPGGGDPVTFGGSSVSLVRNQKLLEKAFAGTGTEVEWFFFKGAGPAVNESLSNRQLDFAFEGDLPQVVARANGLDTHLLAAVGVRSNTYVAIPKGSDIKRIEDLKGRKVGIFRGTNEHLAAISVLKDHGLRERDLKVINLDTGSKQAAVVSKGVDAVFGSYELFKLRDQGLVDIVYSTQGQNPALTRQTALLVRSEYEKAHPQQVQKVLDVLVQAAHWASEPDNRQKVYGEWAKSGVPVTSWQAEFADAPLKVRLSPLLDDFVRARYQAVEIQAKEERLIRHSRQTQGIQQWFVDSYLRKALADQHLEDYWQPTAADGTPLKKAEQAGSPAQDRTADG